MVAVCEIKVGMSWLNIIGVLLGLVQNLVSYLHERKVIDAATKEVLLQNAQDSLEVIAKARAARQAVRDELNKHPERLRDDDGFKRPD